MRIVDLVVVGDGNLDGDGDVTGTPSVDAYAPINRPNNRPNGRPRQVAVAVKVHVID